MADTARFSCEGCDKTYGWKQELAGRKVKCKCGHVMVVPAAAPTADDDGIFDLAPEGPVDPAPPKRPRPAPQSGGSPSGSILGATAVGLTAVPMATPAPRKSIKPASKPAGGRTLSYAPGQTQRDRERTSVANTVDMARDVYVPLGLLVVGFIAYLAFYLTRPNITGGSLTLISIGLGLMMVFKAALMLGFAFAVAGPLGVSFGGIWTAILKLAAIAIFSDGVIAWVDFGVDKFTGMRGLFGGMITLPIALGMFWVLIIYLFSMDPGDSWLVVILLFVFDFIVRFIMIAVLLTIVFKFAGGVGAVVGNTPGGAIGAGTAGVTTVTQENAETAERLDELRTTGHLLEAREYIAGGRQAALTQPTEDFYAAGAKKVWFEVSKDINGKTDPEMYIVELPPEKEKRAKCLEVLKRVYEILSHEPDPENLTDTGSNYIMIVL